MPKIQFYPIDITYKTAADETHIYLYGRTPDGEQICIRDSSIKPYFYVIPTASSFLEHNLPKVEIEKNNTKYKVTGIETIKKNFNEKETTVLKVYVNYPKGVPLIQKEIRDWKAVKSCQEYDILYTRRYLVDKKITPFILTDVQAEPSTEKSKIPIFNAKSIEQNSDNTLTEPKILAVDIETYFEQGKPLDMDSYPIIMVALYGENYKKVITWKSFKTKKGYMEFVDSEEQLLTKLKESIESFSPDILVGYNSDSFDLPYINTRAKKYKIKLDLGLDFSELKRLGRNDTKHEITGICHLDLFLFIRRALGRSMKTDTFTLNAVAEELLNEKKTDIDISLLPAAWDSGDIEQFCEYNLRDTELTYNLTFKILPNILELIKIVGLPLFDLSRVGFSQLVESYIIKQTPDHNEIIPPKTRSQITSSYAGGFVLEPTPGLYNDIVVFDFRSLYPTIIYSHNVSPGTMNCACCDKNQPPNLPYHFCTKNKGFIPELIGSLVTRRMRIKELNKKDDPLLNARIQALKLLANSFYGYLAFPNARWYCLECAESVTSWGRQYIQDVIKQAQEEEFGVLYGDSLPYDRHLFIQFNNGDVKLIAIGELYDKFRSEKGLRTLTYDSKSGTVFAPIRNIIRHKNTDGLLKIRTQYGSTIVTPQHSVYSYDKGIKLSDANNLKVGGNLISLTNPVISVNYKNNYMFDILDLDFGRYQKELYLYSDDLMFPPVKGICPYCHEEYKLSAHVNLRHKDRRTTLDKKSKFSWLGGPNAKTRKIPRYWTLDNDLAWLLGFYSAEGSVSDVKTKSGRKCLLSFGSQDLSIIQRVKQILDVKTATCTNIIKNYDKRNKKHMYYYRVQCMPIVALFEEGFKAGKGSQYKKVPWFFFTAEKSLRESFIRGYLDGDGNSTKDKRYKTHFIRFSTKSKELAEGLSFILKTLNYGTNARGKNIKHISWSMRKDKPLINTLRLQSAKQSKGNYCLAEIKSIQKLSSEDYVYDLEVEGSHNFVDAEGMILVHNTDSVFLLLGKNKTQKQAKDFVDKINTKLPGMMELEYEGFYPSGIFVPMKGREGGAKKKYALIDENNNLKITGFEVVRRNWSYIAKKVQKQVLKIILEENNPNKAEIYVKNIIKDLQNNKIPKEDLVLSVQLQKRPEEYESKAPHVKVAIQMQRKNMPVGPGTLIKYIITKGKGIIGDRAKLPEDAKEYDADYYLNNQILPAVESIFEALGVEINFEQVDQKDLSSFFN